MKADFFEFISGSPMYGSYFHGVEHWKRVERNGLYLSQFTHADTAVVSHFAYMHDCMRENENKDPRHGARAAEVAKMNRELFDLNDEQFKKLCQAVSGHTFGKRSACSTLSTCWDADRLDIARIGVAVKSKYLLNSEAKRIADEYDFQVLEAYRVRVFSEF